MTHDLVLTAEKLAKGDFIHKFNPHFHIVKSEGAFLYTREDRCMLDMEAANGTAALGYDSSILQNALAEVITVPSIPSFCESDIRVNYATRLGAFIENATHQKGKLAFELGGAQGIELAIKIAKMNTGKRKVVVFEGAYHGRSYYTSYLSASKRYREYNCYDDSVIRLPYPDTSDKGFFTSKSYIEYVERLFSNEYSGLFSSKGSFDICAFVFEPILNVGGLISPEPEVINYLARKIRGLGGLLILDEIFTGFYRTGKRFGFEHHNITPDLLVSSKILTNGMVPLSVVWGRDPLMEEANFPIGTHSITFGNNVLSLSVANEVLKRFENWHTLEDDLGQLNIKLKNIFQKCCEKFSIVKGYKLLGACGGLILEKETAAKFLETLKTLRWNSPLEGISGVITAMSSMAPEAVIIKPPLNISPKNLEIFEIFVLEALQKVQQEQN
jgi:4-aminobutyrate aminotransferase-like enzyme